ncbi:MAG: hypothetical protein GY757_07910 [bacterium]|nr:hypothetical protein [bacterium]
MRSDHLIQQAKSIVLQLKKEERRSINPYASFADQVIALITNGRVVSKADILRITRLSYPRPRLNRQWRLFNKILAKELRQLNKVSLLYLFGYLKRLLTIEGKREFEEKKKPNSGGSNYGNDRRYGKHQKHRNNNRG